MIRILGATSGLLALALGVWGPWFRSPVGLLRATACLPFAVAVGCGLWAAFPPRTHGRAGAWLGLTAVGQGAVLQLTSAGPSVGYQHLLPPWTWSGTHIVPLVLLGFQAIAVTLAGRNLPGVLWRWARSRFPGWRFWVLIGFFAITAATLSADPRVYAVELVIAGLLQVLMLATVVLAARALPEAATERLRTAADRWLGDPQARSTRGPMKPDRFAWLTALWVFGVTALLAIFVYGRHPHLPDEVAYLFHARYFALGRLWLDAPPVEEAFRLGLVTIENGRWYSPVLPSWPAVLAVGARFGAAYLVNPVLAALNVILAYGVLGYLYDRRTARLGTLLLAVSPWFLFLGMSFMQHMLSMAATLAAAWCVASLRSGGRALWAVPGGLAIGLVGLTRPLEGLIVATLLGLWTLSAKTPAFAGRVWRVGVMAIASIGTAAVTLPYNRIFTGDPLTVPLVAYTDRMYGPGTNALGFGPDRGLGWTGLDPLPGHGFPDVMINGNLNLFAVNFELLGWAGGSLLVVLIGLLATRRSRSDLLMALVAATVIGAHSFYWFSGGPDYGARYWFLILLPLLALAARGLEAVRDSLRAQPGGPARVHFAALGLAVITMTVFVPWRSIDKYRDYRGMRPDMRRVAAETDFGRGLVLIRGREFPDYASAAMLNPIDLDAPQPVYAHDASPVARRDLVAAFPDRPVWIVDGPERTGGGYAIVAGPLPAGQVPEVEE